MLSIDLLPMEHIPGNLHFIYHDGWWVMDESMNEWIIGRMSAYHDTIGMDIINSIIPICWHLNYCSTIVKVSADWDNNDSIADHYRSINIFHDVLTYSDKYLDKNRHILCKFYTGLSLLLCLLRIIHDCTMLQNQFDCYDAFIH